MRDAGTRTSLATSKINSYVIRAELTAIDELVFSQARRKVSSLGNWVDGGAIFREQKQE